MSDEKKIQTNNLEDHLKHLQRILNTLPVGVAVVNEDLLIQAFNPSAERITGLKASEVLGKPYRKVMKTESRSVADPLEEAIATGQNFVNQRFFLRDDEHEDSKPIRHSASLLTNEAGDVLGGVTIFADISKQVQLEKQLNNQRQLLRDVLYSIPDGVVTVDINLEIRTWNEGATKITGFSANESVGAKCNQILGDNVLTSVEAVLHNGQAEGYLNQKAELPTAHGQPCAVRYSVNQLDSPFDNISSGVVIVFRDISEQLKYQREIQYQRSYLSQVLNMTPYGIFTVDQNMVIQTFNQAAEKLIGFSDVYAIGKPYRDIIKIEIEDGKKNDPLPELLSDQSKTVSARLRLIDAGGKKIPVRYSAAALRDETDELVGAIMVFDDISDIIAAERTKNEFLSMVSHELRTPMTSIRGFVTAVLDGRAGEINEQQTRFLSICREQSDHLLNLINDLLDLSKLESGKMELAEERINIGQLIEQAVKTAQPLTYSKQIKLKTDIQADLPKLWADEGKILQVLHNLLSNAIKFTMSEGEVSVNAEKSKLNELCIRVSDTGVGIPHEEQERIFDPFYQVENIQIRQAGGTGLGLPIVKNIVEAHGGHIELQSTSGQGTSFSVYLPIQKKTEPQVYQPSLASSEEERKPVPPDTTHKIKRETPLILVVDDDQSARTLIEFTLQEEGYDTLTASNGKEAIALAEAQQPDLITLDILMPEIDGFSTLDLLKKNALTANIPVCIVSIIEDRVKGYKLGAIDYITKPFESDNLLNSVQSSLRKRGKKDAEGKFKVLIVEDDPSIVELIELALSEEAYEIHVAHNGVTGLENLRRHLPDLVLLDIMIPKIDGYEFIRHAKAEAKTEDIPIIVLSVRSLEEDITRALRLGAEKYLTKSPGMGEKLSDLVQDIMKETVNDAEEAEETG